MIVGEVESQSKRHLIVESLDNFINSCARSNYGYSIEEGSFMNSIYLEPISPDINNGKEFQFLF